MDPITLIILALIALFGSVSLCYIGWDKGIFTLDKNKIHLGVFGLPQTGKTLFFNALHDNWNAQPDQTTQNEVPGMRLELNGKSIWFKDTTDYGGGDNFWRSNAKKLIKNSDFIVYFCNIAEYNQNQEKAEIVKARLQFIKKCMNENTNVRIVLSYADLVSDRNQARETFVKSISQEDYSFFGHNVVDVNMTDASEVKQMIIRLFYGKDANK